MCASRHGEGGCQTAVATACPVYAANKTATPWQGLWGKLRPSGTWLCLIRIFTRVFENNALIENKKSFWVPPFDRKRRCLLKLFGKSFTKNFYDFSMLSGLTFQTVSNPAARPSGGRSGRPCQETRPPGMSLSFPVARPLSSGRRGGLCRDIAQGSAQLVFISRGQGRLQHAGMALELAQVGQNLIGL